MAFTVRIFGYRGLTQLPVNLPKQFASDAIYQLAQPYEWRDQLEVDGLNVVNSTATAAPDRTTILRVEVPDGQIIRYEINPPNREGGVREADANSPQMSGINQFEFAQGWTISMIDQASAL